MEIVIDPVEPTIHEEEEIDLIEANQDSGKKLDAALNVDDQAKKGKSVPSSKKEKIPAPKQIRKGVSGLKSKIGSKKKVGNINSQAEANNKSGKKTADIISDEQLEEDTASAIQAAANMIVDPDIRMIEEYDLHTLDEQAKWDNILDVTEIIERKDTRNSYTMACKVLGVVPVSTMIDALASSEIKLAHYGIGARGAEALAKSLEKNTTVTVLDLENNWIMSGGAALGYTLSNNRLGRECASALSEMVQYNDALQTVNLSGNEFTDKDIETISDGLSQNTCLKVLDLSHNDIGDVGISALGACLAKNDHLLNLNLSKLLNEITKGWNKIRTRGFFSFFTSIRDNSTLVDLNLEKNGIGENATSLSVFMSRCSLESLNLRSNRIGDVMIQNIAKGLETNSSLVNLDVSYNHFTDKGASPFLKSVLNNNYLQKLNIQGVRLTKESLAKIAELRNGKSDLVIFD